MDDLMEQMGMQKKGPRGMSQKATKQDRDYAQRVRNLVELQKSGVDIVAIAQWTGRKAPKRRDRRVRLAWGMVGNGWVV